MTKGEQAARIPKGVQRETRIDLSELFESLPCRSFTDRDVGIVSDERLAMRGIRDANGETNGDERIKKSDLGFLQRKDAVITSDDSARRDSGSPFAENRVGRGDR